MNESNEEPKTATEPSVEATPAPAEDPAAEAAKYKDLYLRALADYDNARKRAAREKDEAIKYANANLLEKLLPVLDNFELGLEAAKSATDAAAIAQGMAMVQKQLQDFLRDHGVETIPAEGEAFDPSRHEAVAHEAHAEIPEWHVVRQLRRGYKLRDRLLRASTVTVSKGPAE